MVGVFQANNHPSSQPIERYLTMTNISRAEQERSFQIPQLAPRVAICEASEDIHNWENATEDEPAFLVYLGCQADEVEGYIKTLNTFYRCYFCEVRKPKHLKDFEAEIKVRGMQRYSDSNAFGLDYKEQW